MRIRLAPVIATSLASLLFLFSPCINPVLAQPGPGQIQLGPGQVQIPPGFGQPGQGVPLPPMPPLLPSAPQQSLSGVGLCPALAISMRYPDSFGNEGLNRFYTSDNFHWVENWIPLNQFGSVRPENARVLFAFGRHDYTTFLCNRAIIILYDVLNDTSSLFDLEHMHWWYYCGPPTERRFCPTNRDYPIQTVLLRSGLSLEEQSYFQNLFR